MSEDKPEIQATAEPAEAAKAPPAAAKPVPAVRAIDPAPAPMAQSPDPRVAMALAELKEIASLLSREEA